MNKKIAHLNEPTAKYIQRRDNVDILQSAQTFRLVKIPKTFLANILFALFEIHIISLINL